jgi:hypothetical protein
VERKASVRPYIRKGLALGHPLAQQPQRLARHAAAGVGEVAQVLVDRLGQSSWVSWMYSGGTAVRPVTFSRSIAP